MKRFVATLFSLSSIYASELLTVSQLFNVKTTEVKREMRALTQENFGYVKANEQMTYEMTTRFEGYVIRLFANTKYAKVQKGQALAEVYAPEVFKAKEEFLSAFAYGKNSSNTGMTQSAKRKLELLGVSEKEIQELIKSKEAKPFTTLYARHDGYIFEKTLNEGSAFNAKQKLFTLVDLDRVYVEAKLFEEQLASLNEVKSFSVTSVATPSIFTTSKWVLYPKLDPSSAVATLRLTLKNPKHELFPGMYVTITASFEPKSYLTLPSTAVIRKKDAFYVFMKGEYEGDYEPTLVEAQKIDANTYAVEGLEEGSVVVNNALFMMDSDAQINGLY